MSEQTHYKSSPQMLHLLNQGLSIVLRYHNQPGLWRAELIVNDIFFVIRASGDTAIEALQLLDAKLGEASRW